MSVLPTRVDTFISRILHVLSSSLLIGVAAAPYMVKDATLLHPIGIAVLGVVNFLSGGYNIHLLKIRESLQSKASTYFIVITVKLVLWLALTPLLDRLAGGSSETAPLRLAGAVLALALGAFLRYYREKYRIEPARKN